MTTMSSEYAIRTNEWWCAELRSPSAEEATAQLREHLRRGLAGALSGRADVSDADLDDFAQDATIRVLRRLDSFRGDSRFTTWAMAVAMRVAFTALRRRGWGRRSLEDLGISADAAAAVRRPSPDPSGEPVRNELLTMLRCAIDRELTPRQRAAILAELAGMPTAVIAEQMGISPNALYKLHHDGRKKLRQALERAGFGARDVRASLGRTFTR